MRLELAVWIALPPLVRWALVAAGRTAATLRIGDLAAMGLRVRRLT